MPTGLPEFARSITAFGLIGLLLLVLALNWKRLGQSAGPDDETRDGPEPCDGCGYDVRGGLERCPECGQATRAARRNRLADLRTRWPTEALAPRVPDPDERPIVILTTDEGPAATLLCQHLEARGIAARTAAPQVIAGTVYTNMMGGHRLIVWSADEERARAIVARLWGDVAAATPT